MSERIEQAVIAEQQSKIAVGKALEDAVDAELQAERALKEAEGKTQKARRAALRSGWDESTLRKLGLLTTRRATKTTKPVDTTPAEDAWQQGSHQTEPQHSYN